MTDNMKLWNAVSKTNPKHTKDVNQRGGFTAIDAQYQIMAATEQFGPLGVGWGYTTGEMVFQDTLLYMPVTLWHGSRDNTFGPMVGCEEWKSAKGRVDSDASKKATTDGLTKLLSQLGFNADVFLGKFDDQKYVEQMKKEFAEPAPELPDNVTDLLDQIKQTRSKDELATLWEKQGKAFLGTDHQPIINDAFNKRKAA